MECRKPLHRSNRGRSAAINSDKSLFLQNISACLFHSCTRVFKHSVAKPAISMSTWPLAGAECSWVRIDAANSSDSSSVAAAVDEGEVDFEGDRGDRKSTRLNSSH